LQAKELLNLEGFAEKSANNLIESIEASKETTLPRLIYSLGIREVGEATAMNLAINFQNIENFIACSQEDLLEINDVGPIASKFITDYLSDKANTDVIRNLLNLGVNPKEVKIENDNLFSSKSVVITGSFNSIARSQLKEELIRLGARVNSSVSSKTDFLVVGDKPGSKLTKAKELNIRVIEENEFLEMLNS
jgi:DNA ligase (NAD+)